MPIMTESDRTALRQRFEEQLQDDVTIKLFTESSARSLLTVPGQAGCPYCQQTQELAQELAELSPKIKLEVYDFHSQAEEARALGVERIPALVLGDGNDGRLKFYGIPMGYELVTILEGIEGLSRGAPNLQPAVVEAVREAVQEPVRIQVFVTPT